MLHTPHPVSTPVDNPVSETVECECTTADAEWHAVDRIRRVAESRDALIRVIDALAETAIADGCDPVRIRQAAGVL